MSFFFFFFLGTTRNNFEGKKVVSLEYEAYLPMAENEIRKICGNVRQKWPVKHIAVFHRLGYDFLYQFKSLSVVVKATFVLILILRSFSGILYYPEREVHVSFCRTVPLRAACYIVTFGEFCSVESLSPVGLFVTP